MNFDTEGNGVRNMVWQSARLMFTLFFAVCVLLLVGESRALGQEFLLAQGDLFFFEDGRKKPLRLVPKIIVRIRDEYKDNQLSLIKEFSDEFSAINIKEVSGSPFGDVVILEFLPDTSSDQILDAMSFIVDSEKAEASPVFLMNNREAAIDSILVTPKIPTQPRLIEFEIGRLFGNVAVHQISLKGNVFQVFFRDMFLFSNVKTPLNVLMLANLLEKQNKSPWVHKAKPHFWFLSKSITASLRVEPLTGTVSEKRTVILSIRIYDSDITINEKLLPIFSEGNFTPKAGGRISQSFFRVLGPKKRSVFKDSFGKIISYTWKFNWYVSKKEATIPTQKIEFENLSLGSVGEIKTNSVTFLTLLHTKSAIEITDIPPALKLSVPNYKKVSIPESPLPVHWLDRFLSNSKVVGIVSVGIGVGLFVLFCAWFTLNFYRAKRIQGENVIVVSSEEKIEKIKDATNITDKEFCRALDEIVATKLHSVFPALPSGEIVVSAIKGQQVNDEWMGRVFGKDSPHTGMLFEFADKLNERHQEEFSLRDGEREELIKKVLEFLEWFAGKIVKEGVENVSS